MLGSITFDGRRIPCESGDTIGSALHRDGVRVLGRSLKYHRPRGLACCTGSCASCLVDVDGEPNVPACMREAHDGMDVSSQNTLGSAKHDLLGVVDKVYRKGFDPHGAFTKPRILNEAFLKAVRFMSGLGKAPTEQSTGGTPRFETVQVDTLVVGGGKHGLQKALDAAKAGNEVLLIEEASKAGGSALWDPLDQESRKLAYEANKHESITIWTDAVCFGLYDEGAGIMRGATNPDLMQVSSNQIILATGRHEGILIFPNNDLPGILSHRGAKRLWYEHGVLPGTKIAVHGMLEPEFVSDLEAAGATIVAQGTITKASGGTNVERVMLDDQWHVCNTAIIIVPGTPRVELLQQADCDLAFQNGVLAPVVQADGTTTQNHIQAFFTSEVQHG